MKPLPKRRAALALTAPVERRQGHLANSDFSEYDLFQIRLPKRFPLLSDGCKTKVQ